MEMIKFYADAPDGSKNKFLSYKVKDISNSLDLLLRFKAKGWKIRRAYHHFENGKQISIHTRVINNELFNNEP